MSMTESGAACRLKRTAFPQIDLREKTDRLESLGPVQRSPCIVSFRPSVKCKFPKSVQCVVVHSAGNWYKRRTAYNTSPEPSVVHCYM